MANFINLVSWNVSCAIHGEYSAGMSVVDKDDEYDVTSHWSPISCTLEATAPTIQAAGVATSDVAGSIQHVYGIIESISSTEGISEKTKSFKVVSFFSRLQNKPVIEHGTGTIQSILNTIALGDCGMPADLFDFSAVPTQYTYTGIIKGENVLTEMRRLAQAATCYLFVNEQGKLIVAPWKDAGSSVDYTIPPAFIIGAGKELTPKPPASIVKVRGQDLGSVDPPGHFIRSASKLANANLGTGGVVRAHHTGASSPAGLSQVTKISKGGTITLPPNIWNADAPKSDEQGMGMSPGVEDVAWNSKGELVKVKENATRENFTPSGLGGVAATNFITATAVSGQGIFGRKILIICNAVPTAASISVRTRGQRITVTFESGTADLDAIIAAINANVAAAKQVTMSGVGTSAVLNRFTFFLDDGETIDRDEELEYGMEATSVGYRPPEDLGKSGAVRFGDYKTKTDLDLRALRDFESGEEVHKAGFPAGGARAGQSDDDMQSDEPDPLRVEASLGDCNVLTFAGIAREEVDNEYIASNSQADLVAIRYINEVDLDRNSYKVDMVYNPNIKLNDVVQFDLPQTGVTIRGPVVDMTINYAANPQATMSITVQNVLSLGNDPPSSNLITFPDIPYMGGQVWVDKFSKAFKANYSANTIAIGAGTPCVITDTANGFVDAGFIANQWIYITNSAHPENIGRFQIASLSAGTLTMRANDTLISEAAGRTLQLRHAAAEPSEFQYVRALAGTIVLNMKDSGVARFAQQTIATIIGKTYKFKFSANRVSGVTALVFTYGTGSATITPATEQTLLEYEYSHIASSISTTLKWEATGECRWEVSTVAAHRTN